MFPTSRIGDSTYSAQIIDSDSALKAFLKQKNAITKQVDQSTNSTTLDELFKGFEESKSND